MYPLIIVEWIGICGITVRTVGWLIEETSDSIILSFQLDQGWQAIGQVAIPTNRVLTRNFI